MSIYAADCVVYKHEFNWTKAVAIRNNILLPAPQVDKGQIRTDL